MEQSDELLQKLITKIDEALEKNDWSITPYTRMVASKLKEYREQLVQSAASESNAAQAEQTNEALIPEGMVPLYVILYSAEAEIWQKWLQLIASLGDNIHSRPMYLDPLQARHFVQSKINKQNYGYCKVLVPQSDLIQTVYGQDQKDVFGNPLVKLKNVNLRAEHILSFVLQEREYRYQNGKLVEMQTKDTSSL